jgi:hypothetical protein
MCVTTTLFLLAAGAGPALFAAGPVLMPMPVKMQATPGRFPINANFVVETSGGANARLAPAVRAFLSRVTRQTGVRYAPVLPAPAEARHLSIDCAGGPEYPALGEDESYTLDVSDTEARIKAATAEGAVVPDAASGCADEPEEAQQEGEDGRRGGREGYTSSEGRVAGEGECRTDASRAATAAGQRGSTESVGGCAPGRVPPGKSAGGGFGA